MKTTLVAALASLMLMRSVLALTHTVGTEADLVNILTALSDGDTVELTADISLTQNLPAAPNGVGFTVTSDAGRREIDCNGNKGFRGAITAVNLSFKECSKFAIKSKNGPVSVSDCDFTHCTGGQGAAIHVDGYDLTVEGSCFDFNTAHTFGGAIHWAGPAGSSALIEDCDFSGNYGGGAGGAIHLVGQGTATVSSSSFTGNSADEGGAIWSSVVLVVDDCEFINNQVDQSGGAIHLCKVTLVTDSDFTGNVAGQRGGAIYVSPSGALTVAGGSIVGNDGGSGPGAIGATTGGVIIETGLIAPVITANSPENVDVAGTESDCGVCDFGTCDFSGIADDNCLCWPGFVRQDGLCIIGSPEAPSLCSSTIFDPTADSNPLGTIYGLSGELSIRNSFWDSEWTILRTNSSLPASLTWSAGSNVAEVSAQLSDDTRGAICSVVYTCGNVSSPASDGSYTLGECNGTVECPHSTADFGTSLALTPKANENGFEATLIQQTPSQWELSAWVCYVTGTYRGEDIVSCGDLTVVPSCFAVVN